MPKFTFVCGCGHKENFYQSPDGPTERTCAKCSGMMFRTMGAPTARPMETRDAERGKSLPIGLSEQLRDRAMEHERKINRDRG
jgi:hypothetical protein